MALVPFFYLFFAFICYAKIEAANILVLSTVTSPSHGLWNFKIVEALVAKGHNVTVLSVDKPKKPINSSHVLEMEKVYQIGYSDKNADLQGFMESNVFKEIELLFNFGYIFCDAISQTESFKKLLEYPDDFKFDLIINDFTGGSCALGFLDKFNYPPLVGISPHKFTTHLVEIMGGHFFTGYIPRINFPFTTKMNFFQRLKNTLHVLYEMIYRKYVFQPKFDELNRSMFRNKNLPSIHDLDQKTVVSLVNTHPAIDFPVPMPPNIIEVGGLQVSEPKPLPQDLEDFINNSPRGAIFVSFGTNVKSNIFNEKKQKVIVNVAKKFPDYNFLWKFESDISKGKVANLMVKPWLPQNDILAHPKIKVFVSHGGGLSTQESTWHGVPVVGMPFFMDQITNVLQGVLAGVATKVDVHSINENDLENAIRTLLEDPSYSMRMKKRSRAFRDRPLKPLDEAVWWIEYVLREPNPAHIRSPVLDLGHFRANLYDILIVGVIVLLSVCFLLYYVTCRAKKLIFGTKQLSKTKIN